MNNDNEEVEMNMEDNGNQNTKKFDTKKSLLFSMDVLMIVAKVVSVIVLIYAFILLITSITYFSNSSTNNYAIELLLTSIVLIFYGVFRFWVINRYKNLNYKFNVNDVVLTMFLSVPCAVLMMIYKGFE